MREKVNALLGRKIPNLQELKEFTEAALEDGIIASCYEVTTQVQLNNEAFISFSRDFLEDQDWIDSTEECIRVLNSETGEKILVFPEGYKYARYTALELE